MTPLGRSSLGGFQQDLLGGGGAVLPVMAGGLATSSGGFRPAGLALGGDIRGGGGYGGGYSAGGWASVGVADRLPWPERSGHAVDLREGRAQGSTTLPLQPNAGAASRGAVYDWELPIISGGGGGGGGGLRAGLGNGTGGRAQDGRGSLLTAVEAQQRQVEAARRQYRALEVVQPDTAFLSEALAAAGSAQPFAAATMADAGHPGAFFGAAYGIEPAMHSAHQALHAEAPFTADMRCVR